ncbi:rhomboid family intramembrane serine protease [Bacteroidota bacterium]
MRNQFSSSFLNIPPVVKNLLLINVLLFVFKSILIQKNIDLTQYLGLYYFGSEFFRPHQFITHMFMHADITHIFFNMFALWMFGKILESVWGSKRFMVYFFVTGIGAAVLHTFVNWISISKVLAAAQAVTENPTPDSFSLFVSNHFKAYYSQVYEFVSMWSQNPGNSAYISQANYYIRDLLDLNQNIPTVGASGAVFGVLLAFGMLFPNTKLMLLFPPIPIKAKYFVIGYGLIELFAAVLNQPGDNIAHFAHLGGMIFGYFLIKYWNKHGSAFY